MDMSRQRIPIGSSASVMLVAFMIDACLLLGDGPNAVLNLWLTMNIGPALLGIAFSGNIHQPSAAGVLVGQVLQWGGIG